MQAAQPEITFDHSKATPMRPERSVVAAPVTSVHRSSARVQARLVTDNGTAFNGSAPAKSSHAPPDQDHLRSKPIKHLEQLKLIEVEEC